GAPTTTGIPVPQAVTKNASTADQAAPAGGAAASGASAEGTAGAPAPAHSETNVQEAGVDEPDLIKTDGQKLFALTNGVLRSFTIVDGVPRPAGSLSLADRAGQGQQQLLLAGDKLLVLSKGVNGTVGSATTRRAPAVDDDDVVSNGAIAPTIGTQLVE